VPTEEQVRAVRVQRLRYLKAIYELELLGERFPEAVEVARDAGMSTLDWDAIKNVTEALEADELIEGSPSAELGLVTVGLTARGRRLVEEKAAGHEPSGGSPASVGNIQIDGSDNIVNVQQHSPGAIQQAEITPYDRRRMLQWIEDVERRASSHGLPSEDLAEVQTELAELRAELDQEKPDPGKIRRIGKYVLRILGGAAGSLASAGLIEAGQALFS
jgi:hypothetical protein